MSPWGLGRYGFIYAYLFAHLHIYTCIQQFPTDQEIRELGISSQMWAIFTFPYIRLETSSK